jgi:hypothetical protein
VSYSRAKRVVQICNGPAHPYGAAQPHDTAHIGHAVLQPSHTGGPHNQPHQSPISLSVAHWLGRTPPAPHAASSGFSLRAALSVSPSLSQNLNPRLLEPPAAAVRGAAEQAAAPPRRRAAAPVCGVCPPTSARLPSARRPCSSPSARLPRRRPRPSPCSAVRRPLAHRRSSARLHESSRTGWLMVTLIMSWLTS